MMLGSAGLSYLSLSIFSDVYEIHIVFSDNVGNRAVCLLDYLASSSFSWGFAASSQTH